MNIIPLDRAVLCLDCNSLSETSGSECPACGHRALMNLARAIGQVSDSREETKCESSSAVRGVVA